MREWWGDRKDSDGAERLVMCPVCEYSLEHLSAEGRCPECGFEYDERSAIHRRNVAGNVLGRALMASVLALIAIALVRYRRTLWAANPNWDLIVAVTAIACGFVSIVLALIAIWTARRHAYWCTGPVELVIRPLLQKPKRIRWADKRGFRALPAAFPLRGVVVVERLRGPSFRLRGGLGGTDAEIRDFMEEVHCRMRDVRSREPLRRKTSGL
ncbi:MAG: hypothetical protein KDA33_07515 [Phycisphaerales bacterium]|nr:hypothetical protein [Phycisphaerales bacterium]